MMSSALSSTCMACRLRLSRLPLERWRPSYTQVRGKKKSAKPRTNIDVRLIKDLPGYGRKGSIVPVSIGQMRNFYFPERIADYVTWSESRQLKKAGVIAQRDVNFGWEVSKEEGVELKQLETVMLEQPGRSTRRPDAMRVELDMLSPLQAFETLSSLIPPSINFYRTPITNTEFIRSTAVPAVSSREGIQEAGSNAGEYMSQNAGMYGSVTIADIATSLKALLAADEATAGRVIINEQDIAFTGESSSETRLKRFGNFDFEISVKGKDQTIRRRIAILVEEGGRAKENETSQMIEELAGEQPISGEPSADVLAMEARVNEKNEEVGTLIDETREALERISVDSRARIKTPAQVAEGRWNYREVQAYETPQNLRC